MALPGLPPGLFERLGLGNPSRVAPLVGHSTGWQVSFAEGNTLIARHLDPTPYRSGLHAMLGMQLATGVGVPADRTTLGPALWLMAVPAGVRAVNQASLEATVHTLQQLARITAPHFGHRPGNSRFWPTARSWSAAIEARATASAERAADPDLAAVLVTAVRDRRGALDAIPGFRLVHGTLTPANVWIDGEDVVITGWERAHWGDPLEDLLGLLRGPLPAVQAVAPLVQAVDGAGRKRLEAYLACKLLEQLADPVDAADAGRRSAQARRAWRAIEVGWNWTEALPSPSAAAILVQQQLFALRLTAPELIDATLGRLAAGLLADRLDPLPREDLLRQAADLPAGWVEAPPGTKLGARSSLAGSRSPRALALWSLANAAASQGAAIPWGSIEALIPALEALDHQWASSLASEGAKSRAGHGFLLGVFEAVSGLGDRPTALANAKAAAGALEQGLLLLKGYDTDALSTVEQLAGSTFTESYQWIVYPVLHALDALHQQVEPFVLPDSVPRWFGVGS